MISVLILTFNEETNLARCLDSVNWCDDIVVLDSCSTDRTVEIAESRGARVLRRRFTNFADQRNFGLQNGSFKHDWVLHLDADERVTAALRNEMVSAVQSGQKRAYRISSKLMFQGRWLKHAGLFPWYQVRLGRRDALSFIQVGHGQRETLDAEKIGTLDESLLHYSFSKGLSDWIEKHNRYSTAEASHACENPARFEWREIFATEAHRRRRALKNCFSRLPCRPFLRFVYMYFFRCGFLDGRAGLTYCVMLSVYEYFIVLKIREKQLQAKEISR